MDVSIFIISNLNGSCLIDVSSFEMFSNSHIYILLTKNNIIVWSTPYICDHKL